MAKRHDDGDRLYDAIRCGDREPPPGYPGRVGRPTVVQFGPPPGMDFLSALAWYSRNRRLLSQTVPPVNATGDQAADAYLAAVFAALTAPDFGPVLIKLGHLTLKAQEQRESAARCFGSARRHPAEADAYRAAARIHCQIAMILSDWAAQIATAAIDYPSRTWSA